ncbi:hypothetical protein [Emticicia sp. BO119]|nr:hypothetical protein [Emticicia sp. BO119]
MVGTFLEEGSTGSLFKRVIGFITLFKLSWDAQPTITAAIEIP